MTEGWVFVSSKPHGTTRPLLEPRGLGGRITIIISSLRAFRRARDREAKGRVDWKQSRWLDAKFEVAGAKCALRNDRSPAQSFARSLTHSLAREKRDERGSRPRKTTTTRRREKREERREKSEESRERQSRGRRAERREKRQERIQKTEESREEREGRREKVSQDRQTEVANKLVTRMK